MTDLQFKRAVIWLLCLIVRRTFNVTNLRDATRMANLEEFAHKE